MLSLSTQLPGMEALGNLVSPIHCSYSRKLNQQYGKFPSISIQRGGLSLRRPSVISSKASVYQDFQGYAKPLRLLPVKEPSICTDSSLEEMSTLLRRNSQSVYVVELCTSSMFGSGLSDLSSGILLGLIDENGDSILQRISATPGGISMEGDFPNICLQRGSVDKFLFEGPKLGRIQAVWIGLESGRWRLGGMRLTVLCECEAPPDNTEDDIQISHNIGLQYGFEAEDIAVGEGGDVSMVELKPSHVTKLHKNDLLNLSNTTLSQTTSLLNREDFNRESMKEYADLKTSLLLYDSMLIIAGTAIAAISTGEKAALAFLTGGTVGFLYLLLLQKSVDELPAAASLSTTRDENNIDQLVKKLRGPVSTLVLAFTVVGVAVKYGSSGGTPIALTPEEILVGMTGFLVCKIAVLLAAFKPMQIQLMEE